MILNVVVDGQTHPLDVPADVVTDGESFFATIDRDMDGGWQMSRDYVERPNVVQRCQIVADRIVSAMHTDNAALTLLLAGYILTRLPGVRGVVVDDSGEMLNTTMVMADGRQLTADAGT